MRALACMGLLIAVLAQAPPPPGAGEGNSMTAEQLAALEAALREEPVRIQARLFRPALDGASYLESAQAEPSEMALLQDARETAYVRIDEDEGTSPSWGNPAYLELGSGFRMAVTPLEEGEDGAVSMNVDLYITGKAGWPKEPTVRAEARAFREQPLAIAGLPHLDREYTIVFRVRAEGDGETGAGEENEGEPEGEDEPPTESEGSASDGEGENREDGEKRPEGEGNSEEPGKDGDAGGVSEDPEAAGEEAEEGEPLQNLEALLDSLEEMDRQEQQHKLESRGTIKAESDWW